MITLITDHIDRARARYLEQVKGKPLFDGLMEALVKPLQTAETDGFATFYIHNSVDTATGVQLDLWGEIAGLARIPGQSDLDYRTAIKGRIGQNVSKGEVESIIQTYLTLAGATVAYLQDMAQTLLVQGNVMLPDQEFADRLFLELEKATAAGVRIGYLVGYEDEGFALDGPDVGLGLGTTTDVNIGGKMATVWTRKDKEFALDGPDTEGGGLGTIFDPLVGGVFV